MILERVENAQREAGPDRCTEIKRHPGNLGIGEIGIAGVGAAVANAIYNATGQNSERRGSPAKRKSNDKEAVFDRIVIEFGYSRRYSVRQILL